MNRLCPLQHHTRYRSSMRVHKLLHILHRMHLHVHHAWLRVAHHPLLRHMAMLALLHCSARIVRCLRCATSKHCCASTELATFLINTTKHFCLKKSAQTYCVGLCVRYICVGGCWQAAGRLMGSSWGAAGRPSVAHRNILMNDFVLAKNLN